MRIVHLVSSGIGFLALGLLGCGSGGSEDHEFVVRDSAGIRIADNGDVTEREVSRWVLSEEPVLELGTLGGPQSLQFHQVRGAVLTADGGIAVANAGSHEVRLFDRDGAFIRAIGREGQGPGEFQRMSGIWRARGDTLVVFDAGLHRTSLFAIEGEYVRSIRPEGQSAIIRQVGVFSDGSFLFEDWPISENQQEGQAYQAYVDYMRVSYDGGRVSSLGRFPRSLNFDLIRPPGFVESRPAYFGPSTSAAVSDNGFYVGTAESSRVDLLNWDGQPLRRIQWGAPVRPITGADQAEYIDWRIARLESEEEQRQLRAEAEEWVFGPTFRAYSAVHADADANLWVQPFNEPWGERRSPWLVFSVEGEFLARVAVPEGLEVLEVGESYVLALARDEFQAEYVRLYQLIREE